MTKTIKPHRLSIPQTVIAYHGSACPIEQFDYQFTGIGNDQNGSGFYFTTDPGEALGYTEYELNSQTKPGANGNPTVHKAEVHFDCLMPNDAQFSISPAQVKRMVRYAPNLRDALENWGDLSRYSMTHVLNEAVGHYAHHKDDGPTIRTLFKIANDFFDGETEAFNRAMLEVLGIDGIVEHYPDKSHFVAFFPNQIDIIERLTPQEAQARLGLDDEYDAQSNTGAAHQRPKG